MVQQTQCRSQREPIQPLCCYILETMRNEQLVAVAPRTLYDRRNAVGLLLACVCIFVGTSQGLRAQTDDRVASTVNRLRASGGGCGVDLPPLASRRELNLAASRTAEGAAVGEAIKASGYRATHAQIITVSGDSWRSRLDTVLTGRFCSVVGRKDLSDIGVYGSANQVWIVLAAPFAPKVDLTRAQTAERMLALVNQARGEPRRCGDRSFAAARPLVWDETLEAAAAAHAADMATHDYFSHTARDGSTPAQRVTRAGYRYRMTGENIAAGQLTPESAMAGWIKSPGHCANLMNAGYAELGVAFAVNPKSTMGAYWVQMFGTHR